MSLLTENHVRMTEPRPKGDSRTVARYRVAYADGRVRFKQLDNHSVEQWREMPGVVSVERVTDGRQ